MTGALRAYVVRKEDEHVAPRHIWSGMIRSPDLAEPALGFPTLAQVQRFVKHVRWQHGTKNSIVKAEELVRECAFRDDLDSSSSFVFGAREDDDGFPHVGNGEDHDPVILGVTTVKLMESIVALQAREAFHLFHLDATFKLSDLVYPVLTCGFSDQARVYHLAAVFIVSRRTHNEYGQAIGSLVRLFHTKLRYRLKITAVMGDAEDAQMNGLRDVSAFDDSSYLMCFFHVLFNVRKRIRHLPPHIQASALRGILDMHYAPSRDQYVQVSERVIKEWREEDRLKTFADYFYQQWMEGRFWRWQIFHSPTRYATTNNPCETFNATIKRYTHRKALDVCRLLKTLMVIAEDTSKCVSTIGLRTDVTPPQEAKQLARALVNTDRVSIFRTDDKSVLLVLYLGDDDHDECDALPSTRSKTPRHDEPSNSKSLSDADKKKAAAFYRSAVKWSVRRAHHVGMPREGWAVKFEAGECHCSYYLKFGSCAHVICARVIQGLSVPGVQAKTLKFKNRRIRPARASQRKEQTQRQPQQAPSSVQHHPQQLQVGSSQYHQLEHQQHPQQLQLQLGSSQYHQLEHQQHPQQLQLQQLGSSQYHQLEHQQHHPLQHWPQNQTPQHFQDQSDQSPQDPLSTNEYQRQHLDGFDERLRIHTLGLFHQRDRMELPRTSGRPPLASRALDIQYILG